MLLGETRGQQLLVPADQPLEQTVFGVQAHGFECLDGDLIVGHARGSDLCLEIELTAR
jgi:hypothetical protein